jgi:hypothetical protein
MNCCHCKKPLPDIYWRLYLSAPAKKPVHNYCGDCRNGERGADWMTDWSEITGGTVRWFRHRLSAPN